jgi:hypothetical protein
LESGIREAANLESGIREASWNPPCGFALNLESAPRPIWNLEFGIWNLESGIWNFESGIRSAANLKSAQRLFRGQKGRFKVDFRPILWSNKL